MSYPRSIPVLDEVATTALLARVIDAAAEVGSDGIVVFDLDSTLLDNRPRQAQILREYGAQHRLVALEGHQADHWQGWDARIAMANGGLCPELIDEHLGRFRVFWKERFFTSEYCVLDRALGGAPEYVAAVVGTGVRLFYVTGRHEEMRAGTVACFDRIGLACPDGDGVELVMKPALDEHDDAYKARTYATLRRRGRVVAAFDNEPVHINGYLEAFADSICVHLATDHSMRDIPVAPSIPSIRNFSAYPRSRPTR